MPQVLRQKATWRESLRHYGVVSTYGSDPPADRLVADSEREPVLESLRRGFADGRLTQPEFEQRLAQAMSVRTHGQLAAVLIGLPEGERKAYLVGGASFLAEERGQGAAAHALGIVTSFIGPLVIYLIAKRNGSGFARAHAAEALNLQLTLLIAAIVPIGWLLWPVAWVFCVIGATNAGHGRPYRYPAAIRFVRY